MMLRMLCLTSLMFVATVARADDAKDLVGTWTIEKATLNGRDVGEALKTLKLTIEAGGKYSTKSGEETDKGTFTLDTKASPKAMDIKSESGPLKGKTMPAIYELKGDTLKICYGLGLTDRPTKFESPADGKLFLVEYKREKK